MSTYTEFLPHRNEKLNLVAVEETKEVVGEELAPLWSCACCGHRIHTLVCPYCGMGGRGT